MAACSKRNNYLLEWKKIFIKTKKIFQHKILENLVPDVCSNATKY